VHRFHDLGRALRTGGATGRRHGWYLRGRSPWYEDNYWEQWELATQVFETITLEMLEHVADEVRYRVITSWVRA
jgi:hypothetical protein